MEIEASRRDTLFQDHRAGVVKHKDSHQAEELGKTQMGWGRFLGRGVDVWAAARLFSVKHSPASTVWGLPCVMHVHALNLSDGPFPVLSLSPYRVVFGGAGEGSFSFLSGTK